MSPRYRTRVHFADAPSEEVTVLATDRDVVPIAVGHQAERAGLWPDDEPTSIEILGIVDERGEWIQRFGSWALAFLGGVLSRGMISW